MESSPAASSEPDPRNTLQFLDTVEQLATPIYADCLSDATVKIRDSVFISGLVMITLGSGFLTNNGLRFELLGFSLAASLSTKALLISVSAIGVYFLVVFSTRSYADWMLWRLRHQAPIAKLLDLTVDIYREGSNEAFEAQAAISDASTAYFTRIEKPAGLKQLELDRDTAFQQMMISTTEFAKFNAATLLYHELNDELAAEEKTWSEEVVEPAKLAHRKALEQRPNGNYAKQIAYVRDRLRPAALLIPLRFTFEIFFPILFGAAALVIAIIGFRHS
jgi:hypothetical protein